MLDLRAIEESPNSRPLSSPSQQKLSSKSNSSATVATRPEGAVADPTKPKADALFATAEHPPGVGEATRAGAVAGKPAGGETRISFRLSSVSKGQAAGTCLLLLQMSNTGAIAAAVRIAPSTGDGGETLGFGAGGGATFVLGFGARGGAKFAEGITKGAIATKGEGQKNILKSKAKESERSSCIKGHSRGAAEASYDATDAGAWGDPHEMGTEDTDRHHRD